MARHGKKYNAAFAKVEKDHNYDPKEALELIKSMAYAGFNETVEVHMRMGLDPRQADQQLRDVVVLPNGLGKTVRVLVFAQAEAAEEARAAGADIVADTDEMINKIQAGWTDFDVAISTMDMMAKASKLGRVLGPRGLMPNPKAGTVVQPADIARAIKEAKAGRVEFRLDKTANVHVPIGKTSFSTEELFQNLSVLMNAIRRAKPAAAKGTYIRRITLTSTMGPGIHVDIYTTQNLGSTAL